MKRLSSLMVAALFLGGLASTSRAAVLGPITTSTPIPSTLTDWTGSLSFSQFDPSLGTLLSVELSLSGSFSTTLTITNNSPSSSHGSAWTEVQLTVQDPGNNLTAPELDLFSTTYNYTLGANQGISSGLLTQSGSHSDLYTSGAVLTEFTGLGNTVLNADTFTQTILANSGGNTAASQVTDAQLTGTVTYTYEVVPAPEPSTIGLVALALGVVPLIRRKRQ